MVEARVFRRKRVQKKMCSDESWYVWL